MLFQGAVGSGAAGPPDRGLSNALSLDRLQASGCGAGGGETVAGKVYRESALSPYAESSRRCQRPPDAHSPSPVPSLNQRTCRSYL